MKYPYTVVHDGILYRPGEEVPIAGEPRVTQSKEKGTDKVEPKQTPAVEPEKPKRGRKRK